MREILFIGHRIPFPPDRGDKIRSHHILKRLARIAQRDRVDPVGRVRIAHVEAEDVVRDATRERGIRIFGERRAAGGPAFQ